MSKILANQWGTILPFYFARSKVCIFLVYLYFNTFFMRKTIILLFSCLSLIFSTIYAYSLNENDHKLVNIVTIKIESLIDKKWEIYRNKYIKELRKLDNKYKDNERLSLIINEVINSLDNENISFEKILLESDNQDNIVLWNKSPSIGLQDSCKSQALIYRNDILTNMPPAHYTSHWNTKYQKCFAEFVFLSSGNFWTLEIMSIRDVWDYEGYSYLSMAKNLSTGVVNSCSSRWNVLNSHEMADIICNSEIEYETLRKEYMTN